MPPSSETNQQANWCLSCALFTIFVIIGISFFVSSTFFNGILIIGLPVILMLIAIGCLLSNKPSEEPVNIDEEVGLHRITDEFDERNPFTDCPPSYRLTWRRSFLKRLKSTSMFSDRSGENTTPVTSDVKGNTNESPSSDMAEAAISVEIVSSLDASDTSKDNTVDNRRNNGLPTYDEAIDIMTSRENIS